MSANLKIIKIRDCSSFGKPCVPAIGSIVFPGILYTWIIGFRPIIMTDGIGRDSKRMTPERYMQAKTFLENGVISKEEFLEMTSGYTEIEEDSSSQMLASIQKIVNNMELRLKRLEQMIQILIDSKNSQT